MGKEMNRKQDRFLKRERMKGEYAKKMERFALKTKGIYLPDCIWKTICMNIEFR